MLHVTLQPPGPGGTRQFTGKTRINRNDFNMTAYAFLVGDTVDIEIRALLRPSRAGRLQRAYAQNPTPHHRPVRICG